MAATKHDLALVDDQDVRPGKKIKTRDDGTLSDRISRKKVKKDKKDKKKHKKRTSGDDDRQTGDSKSEILGGQANAESEALDQRRAAKMAKKREESLRIAQTPQRDTQSQDARVEDQPVRARERSRKESKKNSDSDESPSFEPRTYEQTISLSSIPQAEIDAFLSNNFISITDPRNEVSSLRPVIDFHHLPSTNLLEKTPSPFANFKTPTPIQAASWPSTLSGRDVVGVAETGSGKTMAFALPCVEVVSSIGKKGTKAVIVSPTRELAMQTHTQLASLAALARLKCVCLYGGASKDEQRATVQRGADIIVATPGRLKDFMSDGTVDLSSCVFAVLDEADRMLDKGFEDDIKQILGACATLEKRQTLMFTATWPMSVQALASTFMVDPVKITIGSGGKEAEDGSVELQANSRITQKVEIVEPKDKELRLLQILKQHQQGKQKNDRILVFCLYKKEATRVENFLRRKGVNVGGIHGDLKQEQRSKSLEAFKSGQTPVLVATDVAARGLDIPEVKLVINVTFPLTIEDYVHRIGRTGRAGNVGEAHTLFTIQDKAHSGSLVNILKGANQEVPADLMKFGTTVKKKTHDMYGSFFKDVDMTQKATKITFD